MRNKRDICKVLRDTEKEEKSEEQNENKTDKEKDEKNEEDSDGENEEDTENRKKGDDKNSNDKGNGDGSGSGSGSGKGDDGNNEDDNEEGKEEKSGSRSGNDNTGRSGMKNDNVDSLESYLLENTNILCDDTNVTQVLHDSEESLQIMGEYVPPKPPLKRKQARKGTDFLKDFSKDEADHIISAFNETLSSLEGAAIMYQNQQCSSPREDGEKLDVDGSSSGFTEYSIPSDIVKAPPGVGGSFRICPANMEEVEGDSDASESSEPSNPFEDSKEEVQLSPNVDEYDGEYEVHASR